MFGRSPIDMFLGGSGLSGGGVLGPLELNLQVAVDVLRQQDLGELGRAVEGALSKAHHAVAKFNDAVQQQGRQTLGTMQEITATLKDFTSDAALFAAQVEVMGTALEQAGKNAGISKEILDSQVESIKELGITTRVANETLQMFIRMNLDVAKASKLARTAQDLAVASGLNSSETLERIITAISTYNPMLLRAVGITENMAAVFDRYARSIGKASDALTETERKQAIVNLVLEHGSKVAGLYERSMEDVGKRLGSLARLYEEARLIIGKQFQGALKVSVDLQTAMLKTFIHMDPRLQALIAGFTKLFMIFTKAVPVMTVLKYGVLWFLINLLGTGTMFTIHRFGSGINALLVMLAKAANFILPSLIAGTTSLMGAGNALTKALTAVNRSLTAFIAAGGSAALVTSSTAVSGWKLFTSLMSQAKAFVAAAIAGKAYNVALGSQLGIIGALTVAIGGFEAKSVAMAPLWQKLVFLINSVVIASMKSLEVVLARVGAAIAGLTVAMWRFFTSTSGFVAGITALTRGFKGLVGVAAGIPYLLGALTTSFVSLAAPIAAVVAVVWKLVDAYKEVRSQYKYLRVEEKKYREEMEERTRLAKRAVSLESVGIGVAEAAKFFGFSKEEAAKAITGMKELRAEKERLAKRADELRRKIEFLQNKIAALSGTTRGYGDVISTATVDLARYEKELHEVNKRMGEIGKVTKDREEELRRYAERIKAVNMNLRIKQELLMTEISIEQELNKLFPGRLSNYNELLEEAIKNQGELVKQLKNTRDHLVDQINSTGTLAELEKRLNDIRERKAELLAELSRAEEEGNKLAIRRIEKAISSASAEQRIVEEVMSAVNAYAEEYKKYLQMIEARIEIRNRRLEESNALMEAAFQQRMRMAKHELEMNKTSIRARLEYIDTIRQELSQVEKSSDRQLQMLEGLKSAYEDYFRHIRSRWEVTREHQRIADERFFENQNMMLQEMRHRLSLFIGGTAEEIRKHDRARIELMHEEVRVAERRAERLRAIHRRRVNDIKEMERMILGLRDLESGYDMNILSNMRKIALAEVDRLERLKEMGRLDSEGDIRLRREKRYVEELNKAMEELEKSGGKMSEPLRSLIDELLQRFKDQLPAMEEEVKKMEDAITRAEQEAEEARARISKLYRDNELRMMNYDLEQFRSHYGARVEIVKAALDSMLKYEKLTEDERRSLLQERLQMERQFFSERMDALRKLFDFFEELSASDRERDMRRLERQRDEFARYLDASQRIADLDAEVARRREMLEKQAVETGKDVAKQLAELEEWRAREVERIKKEEVEEKKALDEWYYLKRKELEDKYKREKEEELKEGIGLTLSMGAFEAMMPEAMKVESRVMKYFEEQRKRAREEEIRRKLGERVRPFAEMLERRIMEARDVDLRARMVRIQLPPGWRAEDGRAVFSPQTLPDGGRDQWLREYYRRQSLTPSERALEAYNKIPWEPPKKSEITMNVKVHGEAKWRGDTVAFVGEESTKILSSPVGDFYKAV